MSKTLKKLLGIGGAGIDESYEDVNQLYDVLKAMVEGAAPALSARQTTIATADIGGMLVDDAEGKLLRLRTSVGTTGTAGSTTVQVHKNGVSQGELTTANTEADGVKKSLTLDVALAAGDLIELVVSAAPTAGADLVASVYTSPITVE
jgi:hypothetical protein